MCACHFDREAVASFLLERSISLDPELGKQIDGGTDRDSFIQAFKKSDFAQVAKLGLWKVFVMEHVSRAVADGDLAAFVGWLQRETWLLGEESVDFQAGMIGAASLNDRGEIIAALLDLDPAILRRQPPAPSKAIEWAFMYGNTHLLPLLTRIWPVPDDLPPAAGLGNPAGEAVARQAPASSEISKIIIPTTTRTRAAFTSRGICRRRSRCSAWRRSPSPSSTRHFDVAGFLLEHKAQISTPTGTPQPGRPASCTT